MVSLLLKSKASVSARSLRSIHQNPTLTLMGSRSKANDSSEARNTLEARVSSEAKDSSEAKGSSEAKDSSNEEAYSPQPLHLALDPSKPPSYSIVGRLLQAKANPRAIGPGGVTPLHLAVLSGDPGLVGRLLAAKAAPDARKKDMRGRKPIDMLETMDEEKLIWMGQEEWAARWRTKVEGDLRKLISDMLLEAEDRVS
mmetsp:Transcript_13584/g.21472  ORF Transcript_13584/g.21472 Transcript_13584/m.21472 type:complete len:198 (+) Transcript_13584:53-646(+)